jgi:ABC-type phosphate transport system substrate-binding protein
MKKNQLVLALAAAGLFGIGAVSAHAQTVVNMGGASAGTPFATEVPLSLCDTSPLPVHYVNGPIPSSGTVTITSGKLHNWVCNQAGNPIAVRYSATGSSDGVKRLQQPESDPLSNMNFLDEVAATGCVGPVLKTRPSDGKQYNEYTGCTGATVADATNALPVNIGWSDTHGSSFHQTGPLTSTVLPLDQSALLSTQVAIVPFAIILGDGVYSVNPATNQVTGPVTNLSMPQVEAIFSRQVTDWRQLGLGSAPVGSAPGTPADATSPITLCLRQAGSGTKAAFDETTMVTATETPFGSAVLTNPADGVYFGQSNQDVRDCIEGNAGAGRPAHIRAAGYMEADQAGAVTGGYIVRMDGYLSNDPSHSSGDPKHDLKCGKFVYWVGERMNTRNPSSSDAAIAALIDDLITTAADPATIGILPAGQFWVAPGQMNVFKNADKGPMLWKPNPVPFSGCQS